MPLLKDEALCLALRPFGKTSQMVVWLTARHGLVTTPVKGAQRPKGAFLAKARAAQFFPTWVPMTPPTGYILAAERPNRSQASR